MTETPKEPVVNIGNSLRRKSYSDPYSKYATYTKSTPEPPLLFEPLKAYRHWRLNNGRLWTPLHGHYEWRDGDNQALCETKQSKASECLQPGCQCGFYSVWNRDADYAYADPIHTGKISGVIEIYGKVVIGSSGARASNARVVALWLPDGQPYKWTPFTRGRNRLMENYPDVRFYRNRDNLIKAEKVTRPNHLFESYTDPGGYG